MMQGGLELGFEIDGAGKRVCVFPSHYSTEEIIQSQVFGTDGSDQEDPFFIVNLGRLASLYNQVGFVIIVLLWLHTSKSSYKVKGVTFNNKKVLAIRNSVMRFLNVEMGGSG